MVIPYLGSAGWYSGWLDARIRGAGDAEAGAEASESLDMKKDLRRALVGMPDNPVMLSVPLRKGPGLLLSGHGNWPHVHLGTINAIYGRTPYFAHFFPLLERVYEKLPDTLPELSATIHSLICDWIDTEAAEMAIKASPDSQLARRGGEIATYINRNISILDAIFRLGRTVGLGLARLKSY